MSSTPSKKPARGASRMARTMRSLMLMGALGASLAAFNVYATGRDMSIATGEEGPRQERFFVQAAERPDIPIFFKGLSPEQRLQMSRNIGRYDQPELATLIGKCLGTFDKDARAALTESLSALAKRHPAAVATQLSLPGSFQQLAVAQALQSAGESVLPVVAERMTDAAARANAGAFLVASGPPAVPVLVPLLDNEDEAVRFAAADALGKLRAREAVDPLIRWFRQAEPEAKLTYLAALSGIGDPATEPMMAATLDDPSIPSPQRAQAALGLGRIGTPSAVRLLWPYTVVEDQRIRLSAISALQIAGDGALEEPAPTAAARVAVAAGIGSVRADAVLREALSQPGMRRVAAEAAEGRATLVPALAEVLISLDPEADGDQADTLVRALVSTPEGLARVRQVQDPRLAGLVERRMRLAGRTADSMGP
jgi:HEAT repeat protein